MYMKKTQRTLITNLNLLLKLKDWSPRRLAQESGVSHRMIAYILAGDRVPTVEVAEQLAAAFNLTGWLLIHPSLTPDLERVEALTEIVDAYMGANRADRDLIWSISQRVKSAEPEQD